MSSKLTHNGITRKQRLFAWILLSVYVPMVLLASLHVHSPINISKAIDCVQCHTAVHHSGHITTSNHHIDECLSCRFLSTQIDVPLTVSSLVVKQVTTHLECFLAGDPVVRAVAQPSLRAPPSML
jgi:hypothetical protein